MTVLHAIAGTAGFFAVASIAWHLFESRWDRRLFTTTGERSSENLTVAKAAALLDSTSPPAILDVRSRHEFDRSHLPGAVHVDSSDPAFPGQLRSLDLTVPYLVYCAGGYRSRKVCGVMKELGFRQIYNLHRGILSWRLRGKPAES